ncbi:sulfurtransferase TusA family protein [Thiomicrorhabdus heinhorstiae]|uniref:Sulfurtransferase TusA family protein n=1 Tax=Thiomicrorhabdus heinhorstiae TaxID=2748010 RepID=A0ABS0C294_9GAMM|nr:sulfurtransferase TusA family protein [Thiomicrorhabdus heinhorstiae]MBF6058321.1 sulfurtransferase TusA family protein [Thiomicrorhabdus heinhorstiae]
MTNQSNGIIELDARGLKCPMPVIKLQQQIRKSQPGNRVRIVCTDKGAEKDIQSWCRVNKHEIIEIFRESDQLSITIEVKERK